MHLNVSGRWSYYPWECSSNMDLVVPCGGRHARGIEVNGTLTRVSQALSNWNMVVLSRSTIGHSRANQIGDMSVHPGTYGIRPSALDHCRRDVGGQLAQNGFKWIFVLNGRGAPKHNIAIDEACDFSAKLSGDDASPDHLLMRMPLFKRAARKSKLHIFGRRALAALVFRHGCVVPA